MTRLGPLIAAAAVALSGQVAGAAESVPMGDDGLHKPDWFHETFKDLREDLDEANAAGKRLVVIVEQRGCIYCTRMHEEVFPTPAIHELLEDDYFAIQINMFGDVEVTDFDGTTLPEKKMVARWGLLFTPTMLFFPEEVPEGEGAREAAVATMPGAFSAGTTLDLLTWIRDKGYAGDEPFQTYHARMIGTRGTPD